MPSSSHFPASEGPLKGPPLGFYLRFTYNSTISPRTAGGFYFLCFYDYALINLEFFIWSPTLSLDLQAGLQKE